MTEMLDGQMSFFDLVSDAGKTCLEHSQATAVATSKPSSKPSAKCAIPMLQYLNLKVGNGLMQEPSWEMVTALPGGSTMLNFGESPSEERGSTLSQILDLNAPEKYSLSKKACAGILRRAEKRGKTLPDMLRDALMEVIGSDG